MCNSSLVTAVFTFVFNCLLERHHHHHHHHQRFLVYDTPEPEQIVKFPLFFLPMVLVAHRTFLGVIQAPLGVMDFRSFNVVSGPFLLVCCNLLDMGISIRGSSFNGRQHLILQCTPDVPDWGGFEVGASCRHCSTTNCW